MQKSTYLIISGLLSFGFLTNGIFPFVTSDLLLVLMLCWSIFGWIYFSHEESPFYEKNKYWVFAIFILFFLSSLTPVFRYGQDFISTCIAMRTNALIIFLISLLKIYPSEDDIFKAIRFLGFLALVMSVFVILFPQWFVDLDTIERLIYRQEAGSTDIAVMWPGSSCAILYFYILLQKMRESPTVKNVFWCCVFMGYIFLMQNRSTLICALPFFIYTFLKADIRYKSWIVVVGGVIVGTYIYNVLSGLIEETQNQLSDSKYNRWQAIYFFLIEQNNNIYTILFGNGVPCKGSAYLNYIIGAQTKRLAFISDIGLLGTYFYYGLAMMVVIYRFIVKGIRSKSIPIFLKYYSWWLLLVPTIHSFGIGSSDSMVRFSLIFYMIIYYEYQYGCISNNSKLQYTRNYQKVFR